MDRRVYPDDLEAFSFIFGFEQKATKDMDVTSEPAPRRSERPGDAKTTQENDKTCSQTSLPQTAGRAETEDATVHMCRDMIQGQERIASIFEYYA